MTDLYDAASLEAAATVAAPDGSVVRPLCRITGAGSFAHFELQPGAVSKAVSHRTVQEIWYVVAGAGEMWRRQQGQESVVSLCPGVCLTIPLGTAFQFRSAGGGQPLEVVAVTMPPWPGDGDGEAVREE